MDVIPTTHVITNYVNNLLTINNKLAAAEGTIKNAPIWDQLDKHNPNLLIFLNNFDNEISEKRKSSSRLVFIFILELQVVIVHGSLLWNGMRSAKY